MRSSGKLQPAIGWQTHTWKMRQLVATGFSVVQIYPTPIFGGRTFVECILAGATFTRAKLYRVKLRDNDLTGVKGLEKNSFRNFGKGIVPRYRILEDYPDQAEPMYRELTAYFSRIGALDDASWAAYRCRLMRHRMLRKRLTLGVNLIEAAVDHNMRHVGIDPQGVFEVGLSAWLSTLIEFFKSGLYWLIFGYGEKPLRVAMLSLEVIVMYAAMYAGMNALTAHGFWAARTSA